MQLCYITAKAGPHAASDTKPDSRGGWATRNESACWKQRGRLHWSCPARNQQLWLAGVRCLLDVCTGLTWFSVSSGLSSTTSPSYTSLFSLMRKPAQVKRGALLLSADQAQHQEGLQPCMQPC